VCRRCQFGWAHPLPTDAELRRLYSDRHHPEAEDDRLNVAERRRIMKRIRTLAPNASSLLEVGCGFGHFLDHAKDFGFETLGVEVDSGRAEVARSKGHQVYCGELQEICQPLRVDVVILHHIIEHLADPFQMLEQVRIVLVPGGLLFVGTPNFSSFRAKLTGAHFEHLCPPEHISYFTPESLRLALKGAGFQELELSCTSHVLHVKELMAYFCYLRFLRTRRWINPFSMTPVCRRRFTERRGSSLRKPLYSAVLLTARLLRPLVERLGGDHIESYWRRT